MAVEYTYEPIKIDIEQVEELYNKMSELVYEDMDKQYKEKKINGATYAETWAKLMQGIISGTLGTIAQLQMKETEADRAYKEAQTEEIAKKSAREDCMSQAECSLKEAQEAKIEYETANILPEQKALTERQREGFDDNLRQKLFEAQMNAWAMMFSSGLLEKLPCFISSDQASHLYKGILDGTMPNYTVPNQGCPEDTSTPPA